MNHEESFTVPTHASPNAGDLLQNWSPEVIETAQWLSQLQLTEPQPFQGTEAKVEGPKEQYASQYAIIDTNQMLDHLDAVNSLLEHVVA